MRLPAATYLNRVMRCPASWLLPQVRTASSEAATRGIEVAAYLEAVLHGATPAKALELVKSDEGRRFVEVIDLDELPAGKVGSFAGEFSLAWNPVSDNASNKPGVEREHVDGWYAGRADVVGADPGAARGIVIDYKTGRDYVKAADDWQLRFLALALARVYHLDTVTVQKIWLRETGDNPGPSTAEFDSFALADFADELRALAATLAKMDARMKAGGSITLHTGEHCRFCPAFQGCDAQGALVRAALRGEVGKGVELEIVTPEAIANLWPRVEAAEKALAELKDRLKAAAREVGPVDLGDGLMLGEKSVISEELDGVKAFAILAETIGEDAAERACPVVARKGAIEDELRAWWREKCESLPEGAPRPKLKDVLSSFRGALLAQDAVKITTNIEVGKFKRK